MRIHPQGRAPERDRDGTVVEQGSKVPATSTCSAVPFLAPPLPMANPFPICLRWFNVMLEIPLFPSFPCSPSSPSLANGPRQHSHPPMPMQDGGFHTAKSLLHVPVAFSFFPGFIFMPDASLSSNPTHLLAAAVQVGVSLGNLIRIRGENPF